ncbi:MAG: 3-hydroxyacyl-CoA dehydrogenase NAD-binding domain-containing protein, partial [Paracoccaceae bacterium]
MSISKVGVIGAGQMGNGIAHVFALAGFDVRLQDISTEALENAGEIIRRNMNRQMAHGSIDENDISAALGRVEMTTDLSSLGASDLVIEAATEREAVKQAIFDELLPHLKPETILTSNTSSISITRLASRTDRPEKFMGF